MFLVPANRSFAEFYRRVLSQSPNVGKFLPEFINCFIAIWVVANGFLLNRFNRLAVEAAQPSS